MIKNRGEVAKPTTYTRGWHQHETGTLNALFLIGAKPAMLYNVHWPVLYNTFPSALVMLLAFAKGIALYGVSWILWRIFERFIVKSPLDNVPGPSSKNWWKGVNKQTELHINDD